MCAYMQALQDAANQLDALIAEAIAAAKASAQNPDDAVARKRMDDSIDAVEALLDSITDKIDSGETVGASCGGECAARA